MATLPNPATTQRKTPSPGGGGGYLSPVSISTPRADTAIGDALQGIGDEAYRYAMAEKARMDDVAVDDAKNQYLQQALALDNEYNQIKGKSAVDQDIVKDYTTKLDGVNEKIAAGFKNDSQRKAWDGYYGRSKVQFLAGVMKHKLNESDTYAAETYKSTNIMRVQNAHSTWADPGTVNQSASDIVTNISKEKVRAGWGEERTEVELKANLGPLWSGVAVQQINAKQYDMAKKTLEQHKDVIGVDKYTSYQKSIEASETIDLSQEHAGRISIEFDGLEAQLKEARKTLNGRLEETTITQLKTLNAEKNAQIVAGKKALGEAQEQTRDDFAKQLLSGELTPLKIENSNLGAKDRIFFSDRLTAKANNQKKIAALIEKKKEEEAEDKLKTDDYVYADLLHRINTAPTEEMYAEISDLTLDGISTDDNEKLTKMLRDELEGKDPKKSADLKLAEIQLKSAETDNLYSTNKGKNTKAWVENQKLLNQWVKQNPGEDPTIFVNKLLAPVKDDILDKIFNMVGSKELPSVVERRELESSLNGKKKKEQSNKVESRGQGTKKVKAKLIKKVDGTHYILFPNGTTKAATIDKDGKVSY